MPSVAGVEVVGGAARLDRRPSGRTLWKFPQGPTDLAPGQTFKTPDDAYFTPNGKQIFVTQEDDHVVRVIDIATRKIVYAYGAAGVPGAGANQLNKPESALMLPSGDLMIPDMKNCRWQYGQALVAGARGSAEQAHLP